MSAGVVTWQIGRLLILSNLYVRKQISHLKHWNGHGGISGPPTAYAKWPATPLNSKQTNTERHANTGTKYQTTPYYNAHYYLDKIKIVNALMYGMQSAFQKQKLKNTDWGIILLMTFCCCFFLTVFFFTSNITNFGNGSSGWMSSTLVPPTGSYNCVSILEFTNSFTIYQETDHNI